MLNSTTLPAMELNFLLACELTPEIQGLESQLFVKHNWVQSSNISFPFPRFFSFHESSSSSSNIDSTAF
jgi:hypothetical protein